MCRYATSQNAKRQFAAIYSQVRRFSLTQILAKEDYNMEERIFAIARYAVGSFLILSGIGMLIDPANGTKAIEYAYMNDQEFLPGDARFQMSGIAVMAILSGLLFLAEKLLYGAITGFYIVLWTFTIPIGEVVVKGINVSTCGCSGVFELHISHGLLLVRNGFIMLVVWWMAYVIQYGRVSYSSGKPRQITPLEMIFRAIKKQ